MKRYETGLLTVVFLAACAVGPNPTGPLYLVSGLVVAGPTCPVETDPPQPGCEARPVEGAVLVITDDGGNEVSRATTDSAGAFDFKVGEGTYTLTPQPVSSLMGTAEAMTFTVSSDMELDPIVYDTGIR